MLGTDKIEALEEAAKKLVIAGKKINADGKVDMSDLPVVIGLLPEIPSFVKAFSEILGAFDQLKDIDVAEAIAQIQKINAIIKEIEKA